MIDLRVSQEAVYQAVRAVSPRAFVRLCADDSALWVSDLPRHCAEMPDWQVQEIRGWIDEERRLLYLDWTEAEWERKIASLGDAVPAFPKAENLHEVYALCRLLLCHPCQRTPKHMPTLRRVLKTLGDAQQKLAQTCRAIREETAAALRSGGTAAYDAGRILAEWIREREGTT